MAFKKFGTNDIQQGGVRDSECGGEIRGVQFNGLSIRLIMNVFFVQAKGSGPTGLGKALKLLL
jgi:hypothetical protein